MTGELSRAGAPRRETAGEVWLRLLVGLVGALWRSRLELTLIGVIVVAQRVLAGLVGAAVAWGVVLGLVAVVLAIPAARGWLRRSLRTARVRRKWWAAWTDCGLPRVRAGRVTSIPAGELVRVRASRGSSLAHVEHRAEELAVCLQVREVRVVRDRENAATGTVTLVRRDPLAGVASVRWPCRDAASLSLWEPIPVGIDELGATVTVSLPERNVLLGGEPGAGKSAALSLLVATAALDPGVRVWLLDGKLVELSVWAPCAQRLAGPDIDEAIELLRELRGEMEQRYRELLARGQRKVAREDGLPLHLVACDELAFYLGHEDRRKQKEFAELLRDLVARGRAAGVIVCAATQKPAADVVPSALRDLFGFRLALRCNTPQASGLRHDPRAGLGFSRARRGDDRAPAARRRAIAGRGRPARADARVPPGRCRRGRAGGTCGGATGGRVALQRGGAVMSARRKVPDELLAERVRRGDELAFRVLATRYGPLMRSLCWFPPPGLDADDLRQEALIGLLEACCVETARSFAAIAARTVRWRVLNARERTRQGGARLLNEAIWLEGGNEDMPAVEGADPAVAVLVREQLRLFVRELPEAVELACQPDVSHVHPPVTIGRALRVIRRGGTVATAAAAVGVNEGAVYGWVNRLPAAREARRSLRRRGTGWHGAHTGTTGGQAA